MSFTSCSISEIMSRLSSGLLKLEESLLMNCLESNRSNPFSAKKRFMLIFLAVWEATFHIGQQYASYIVINVVKCLYPVGVSCNPYDDNVFSYSEKCFSMADDSIFTGMDSWVPSCIFLKTTCPFSNSSSPITQHSNELLD